MTNETTQAVAAPGTVADEQAMQAKRAAKKAEQKAAKPKAKKAAKPVKTAKGKKPKSGKINPSKERLVPANLKEYHVDKKVKTPAGNPSVDNDDKVAKMLRGKDLEATYELAAKHLQDADGNKLTVKALKAKYSQLNPGMQRMNLGNRLRAAL